MYGDVRIHGKLSSVLFADTSSQRNESWKIKPYARKTDPHAMARVREFTVKSSDKYKNLPQCSVNYSVPAVILSTAGYTGNYFHDFTDILLPLFLTSNQFHGEVQFLVANYQWWWLHKYSLIFENLSKYPLIDIDHDDGVHCFQHTIVGLNSHDELRIDPWRSPNGISTVAFTKFLRTAYSLPRESPLVIKNGVAKKPRLLLIARSRTRRFNNTNEIVRMAKKLGFEVVVGDGGKNIAQFSQIVNSCDVMMGVHGAGLTNLVFLPTNAIFIQIVPWGNLQRMCSISFGIPAEGMKLQYLEYEISLDESTLTELYPRDHPVLKDPMSLHKLGWDSMGEIYLVKQNVKLDVRRFKPVLQEALKLLHKQ